MTAFTSIFVLFWALPVSWMIVLSDASGLSDVNSSVSEHGREERAAQDFTEGPNGELCILSRQKHDLYYDHIDGDGRECRCEACRPGRILSQNCTCDPLSPEYQISVCTLVEKGKQRMPNVNICSRGFDCKSCDDPWTVKSECDPSGYDDTECECVKQGFYQPDREHCLPIPRCDKGNEAVPGRAPDWVQLLTHLAAFVVGIVVGYCKQIWSYLCSLWIRLRSCRRGSYVIAPQRSVSLEEGGAGIAGGAGGAGRAGGAARNKKNKKGNTRKRSTSSSKKKGRSSVSKL